MKLTYLPEWQLINQSKQAFAIQEDENSISLVSPINDYTMTKLLIRQLKTIVNPLLPKSKKPINKLLLRIFKRLYNY